MVFGNGMCTLSEAGPRAAVLQHALDTARHHGQNTAQVLCKTNGMAVNASCRHNLQSVTNCDELQPETLFTNFAICDNYFSENLGSFDALPQLRKSAHAGPQSPKYICVMMLAVGCRITDSQQIGSHRLSCEPGRSHTKHVEAMINVQ